MEILNRSTPPEYHKINNIPLLSPQKHTLENGLPVYFLNANTEDVTKIDFIFDAGMWYETHELNAHLTNLMLNEGTLSKTASQLAEIFDFHGAYLQLSTDSNKAYLSVITLNKHLPVIISTLSSIIHESSFPGHEFESLIMKKKDKLTVETGKIKVICQKRFSEVLFGKEHPYALTAWPEDYDSVKLNDLKDFFKTYYKADRCYIIASGSIPPELFSLLNQSFGGQEWLSHTKLSIPQHKIIPSARKSHFFEKKDTIQSALRVGCLSINKSHPDYQGLFILNTVLGGYFGSRLMSNIREEKGYTYGIYSTIIDLKETGYLYIATEVGKEYCQKTLDEIYTELKNLRDKPIPEDELSCVKNYLLGEMLREFDGPFAQAANFRSLLEYNLDNDFYRRFVQTIQDISSQRLLELANTYLIKDNMYEVIVGAH